MTSHRILVAALVAFSTLGSAGCADRLPNARTADGRPVVAVASFRSAPSSAARTSVEDRTQRLAMTATIRDARTDHAARKSIRHH